MRKVLEYAAERHGVISRSEANALGMSNDQIDYRVRTGILRRIAPTVMAVSGAPPTWNQRARGAALSVEGLVSHRSAAFVHGLEGFGAPDVVEIVIPKSRQPRRDTNLIHRSTQFQLAAATEVEAVPVTGIARTIIDLGAVVSMKRVEWALDAALRQQLCAWPDLVSVLICHSIQGRNGCGPLRALLEQRSPNESIPDSTWNRMVGQLIVSAGLPRPAYEHVVSDEKGRFVGRVDLAYPTQRLAIELDSARWHLNRQSFEDDPRRKNKLLNAGWSTLTFTWSDYSERPRELLHTVRQALQCAA